MRRLLEGGVDLRAAFNWVITVVILESVHSVASRFARKNGS